MVHSMQFVHLSCIKISTISKQSKLSFHLSPFTQEYHQVHPKWYLSLWCIRRKLCTYLAPKLTLSPNSPKRDSIWYTSLVVPLGASTVPSSVSKLISEHMVRPCKPCTYLASRLELSPNRQNQDSTWASSPRSTMVHYAQTMHQSCN